MINGFCVNVIAVKTGPVKFDQEHQSKGGKTKTIGGLRKMHLVFLCVLSRHKRLRSIVFYNKQKKVKIYQFENELENAFPAENACECCKLRKSVAKCC